MSHALPGTQGALRERFGIPENQAHRALDDSLVMQEVVSRMLRLNGTSIPEVMARKSKCSGTLKDILGPGINKYSSPDCKCVSGQISQLHTGYLLSP